jgi:hypothetical protein
MENASIAARPVVEMFTQLFNGVAGCLKPGHFLADAAIR